MRFLCIDCYHNMETLLDTPMGYDPTEEGKISLRYFLYSSHSFPLALQHCILSSSEGVVCFTALGWVGRGHTAPSLVFYY